MSSGPNADAENNGDEKVPLWPCYLPYLKKMLTFDDPLESARSEINYGTGFFLSS